MMYSCRTWFIAVAVACLPFSGTMTFVQAQDPPKKQGQGNGQLATTPPEDIQTAPTPVTPREPAYVLPPVCWPTYDFAEPNPLLDRPYVAQPGYFANSETNILWLHLHNKLSAPVPNPVTGNLDQVDLGHTHLDVGVAQRFEFGCRLPDNWGTCSFGYGFLSTQGQQASFTGPEDSLQAIADKRGRLVYNMFDLTYGSREFSLDPFCNMRWGVGFRTLFLYFDSRGNFTAPGSDPGSVLAQFESNFVQQYGAWAYLDLEREFGPPGLACFLRVEGADFFARNHQNYTEVVAGGPGQGPQTTTVSFAGSVGPSSLREVLGISYTVPQWNYSRFMLGYQYEQFFQIGRQSPASGIIDTRGSLDAHGFFLRAEFNF
jgi:hypothetical protein